MSEDGVNQPSQGESSEESAFQEKSRKPQLFKPGQSGNPSGKPKGTISLVSAIKKRLRDNPEEVNEIITGFLKNAKAGDVQAMKVLLDRVDGPIVQKAEIKTRDLSNMSAEELLELRKLTAKANGIEVNDQDAPVDTWFESDVIEGQ